MDANFESEVIQAIKAKGIDIPDPTVIGFVRHTKTYIDLKPLLCVDRLTSVYAVKPANEVKILATHQYRFRIPFLNIAIVFYRLAK